MRARDILLVDDDSNDIELTLAVFEELNLAHRVVVARDGTEALDFLYRRGSFAEVGGGQPVVIILDLKMPKVDGYEVLRHVKNHPDFRTIPVVVLTSSREGRDLKESYDQNANAYVVKPVPFQEFMDVIKKLGLFWALTNETVPEGLGRG